MKSLSIKKLIASFERSGNTVIAQTPRPSDRILQLPGEAVFLFGAIIYFLTLLTVFAFAEEKTKSSKPETDSLVQLLLTTKDPFIPKLPQVKKIINAQGKPIFVPQNLSHPVSQRQAVKPRFQIAGLVWNTNRPQAIVNGQVVSIGDSIGGWIISQITKKGIEVTSEGTTFFIEP